MSPEGALSFFIALFLFGITPGPGVFAVLARALVCGARPCVALAAGMVVSDIAYLLFACFGLAAIAREWEMLFLIIRWAGAAYLVYLGVGLWRAPVGDAPALAPAPAPRGGPGAGFVQGFLISASNPKVILFYMAFLPTFMDLGALRGTDIVLAAGLTFVALMLGLMLIAVGAARARRLLRSARAMRRLNRGAGSIMIGAGAYLATRPG
ncbi:LysE family translocator [Nitrogeniibacter mangrovi]|uniref:LysE family translocator n=1 Tax=Nitrogeniibacter mangrovi TaxID=2016596 RepID=A0A6C1BA77_9RHOO|nr:LysE family translocator [Nitrogeniibacter mangrovi]QID19280.1 LysE family translocator [Nitrogeniibacter mangrovi]